MALETGNRKLETGNRKLDKFARGPLPRPLVLIRGGGDLASGIAARLFRSGLPLLVTEIPRPLAVRRLVCVAEAIFTGDARVEDLRARRIENADQAFETLQTGAIPVLVDPEAECIDRLEPLVVVDARMRKASPERGLELAPLVVGLGPGFFAGVSCHAVIETHRGHHMGRVLWHGSAEADTAMPEAVAGIDVDRVLRAPRRGTMRGLAALGEVLRAGAPVFRVAEETVLAPFGGALRGLLHDDLPVELGMKVADLDPRGEPRFCREISDKSLAVGGGVLEAIFSRAELRRQLAG